MQYLTGYWEIKQVKKDNKILKTYTISTIVDYFEVHKDMTGFRKKVAPNLDGKFIVNDHKSPFRLEIEDDKLHIYYTQNDTEFKETIVKASKKELIITNQEQVLYIYKPYQPITF
ncbi:MAG: hypothetical protein HRT67_08155 [Flavobacteriaceae bacterium]|nr:hypothetical protein [Flavobacteriaceae bacterium]